ncbi:hypothetical protein FMEXI_3142 [Fusarium mexicanum]|uniref:Uncharacterized protein n=1 Tax=Fusarium mexicanum TaxID=751941 RepID=A0A8H5N4G6_9HYPO|nr:hypothetical protein FMEXI_3142 [Fusarium mexicanum]
MTRRSARLASRQSGDATAMLASLSETPNELGEPSSAYPNPHQEWDDDDDDDYEYEDDRDTIEYTQRRRETAARAVATPASSKKIRDSVEVTHEDSEFTLSESEEDEEFLVENELEQECLDLSELPLDPSEVPPEEPESDDDDAELETHRPNKRARISVDTAEQWISDFNQANPVNDDDPDLQRFREAMKLIVEIICNWARQNKSDSLKAWFKLPASERETTSQFRSVLAKVDIQQLIDNIFKHIPNKVQKLLGKQDLRPIDLLDLPQVPQNFMHRLTYVDIAVRAGVNNITRLPGVTKNPVKSIKHGAQLECETEIKVYAGSTMNKRGARKRIRHHEIGSDGKKEKCMHYSYTSQPDVAPNFRIIGIWSNPFVVESLDNTNDIQRWLPVFLEGIIMVFLGLIHRSNKPLVDRSFLELFSEAKYGLIDHLRSNLELPDFHNQSLNQAWSLAQGIAGGMIVVNECDNPACKRPRFFRGKIQTFIPIYGTLSDRVCMACYQFWRKNGTLRTLNRTQHDKSQGPRVCNNPFCDRTEGDPSAPKFIRDRLDNTKWRCGRCHDWQREHNNEDRPSDVRDENRSCCNPNCDTVQVPSGVSSRSIGWAKTVTATGTIEWRCRKCQYYLNYNGTERPGDDEEVERLRRLKTRVDPSRSCSNCGKVQVPGKKMIWYKNKAAEGTFKCNSCWQYYNNTRKNDHKVFGTVERFDDISTCIPFHNIHNLA